MGKRTHYTKITPLPSNIPRQLALDLLNSHTEVIKLNPLVTDVKGIEAPRDAAADEYYSQWYEIHEIITWGPGLKKKISFKGCFYDQPWGLQSHVYAPLGTDLRCKYRIGGNQPGEPRESRELGVNTPQDGLYLREDHEIVCAMPLTAGFVKKEMQTATGIMVDRLTRKAELLEEGKLHAMFEDGKLKTSKPSNAAAPKERDLPSPRLQSSPLNSPDPTVHSTDMPSPNLDANGFGRYEDVVRANSQRRSEGYFPGQRSSRYNGPDGMRYGNELPGVSEVNELQGSYNQYQTPGLYPPPLKPYQGQAFRSELPGDTAFFAPAPYPADIKHQPQYPPYGQPYPASAPPNQTTFEQPHSSPQPSQHSAHSASTAPNPSYPTQQQPSPQPHRQSLDSGYQAANARGPALHPAYRQSMGNGEHQLAINHAQDPNALRASQYSQHSQVSQQSHLSHQSQVSQQDAAGQPYPQKDARDSLYSRNSQHVEPDHQRFSQMSIQPEALDGKLSRPGQKCPVCDLFEGDEGAISHHVSKAHFA